MSDKRVHFIQLNGNKFKMTERHVNVSTKAGSILMAVSKIGHPAPGLLLVRLTDKVANWKTFLADCRMIKSGHIVTEEANILRPNTPIKCIFTNPSLWIIVDQLPKSSAVPNYVRLWTVNSDLQLVNC